MYTQRKAFSVLVMALGVLPMVACGSNRSGLSTAPTSVPAASAPATTSAAIFTTHSNAPEARLSGEAVVTSLVTGTSCPTLSFMLGSFKISVDASTVYVGGTCADIVVGARLRVDGTRKPDNSILASSIELKDHGHARQHVEGEGIITGLKDGTTCPTLTFFIGSKSIDVTDATVFERGTCDDLTIGKRVHVKGEMLDDDVVATMISVQSDSPGFPVIEGEAHVTSLVSGTSCPTLKFKVDEWTVTLSASTIFNNGTCADVAVGKKVGVKGTVTADHEVLATRIVFKTDDN